jgi:hypothetical protein
MKKAFLRITDAQKPTRKGWCSTGSCSALRLWSSHSQSLCMSWKLRSPQTCCYCLDLKCPQKAKCWKLDCHPGDTIGRWWKLCHWGCALEGHIGIPVFLSPSLFPGSKQQWTETSETVGQKLSLSVGIAPLFC